MKREKVVERFAHWITAVPWVSIVFTLLMGTFFIAHLPHLRSRADQGDFYNPKDVDIMRHREIKELYRRNEFFAILFQDKNLFTPDRLNDIATLTASLEELPDIKEVVSLSNVNDMVGTEEAFTVEKFLHEIPTNPTELERLRRRAVDKPLYRRRLISLDGTTTAIGVFLPNNPDELLRRRVLDEVAPLLAPYRDRGIHFHLVGWPVTSVRLIDFMNRDVARFLPLTLFLALGTIWFVFRNVRLLLLAGLGVGLTVSATLGLASFLGVSLNNASVATIPLVMALALSDIVHLFSHLDRSVLVHFPDRRAALKHVLQQILFPCLLTSVNTAIGFLSFTSNRIPAIQSFGWLAASGMMFEFLFTFGLVTPLLLFFKPETIYRDTAAHQNQEIPRLVRWVHRTVSRRPVWILTGCFAALAWGGWQSRKVQVETDLIQYFRPSTTVRQDGEFMKKNLGGFQTMMVEFESYRDAFKDPERLAMIEKLGTALAALPGVDQVTSLADYFKEMNKAFHAEDPAFYRIPATRRLLEQYLLLYSADDLDEVVTPGFDRTRIVLRLHETSSRKNEATLKAVQTLAARIPIPNTRSSVVGDSVDIVNTAHVMVNDQLWNIVQSVGCVWLVMLLVLRSVGMAALFLVPNLFPIVLNFGIMGTFGIPIDTGTALIAASAFGIIVDDTVHFFTRFKERRDQGWSFARALEDVTHEKGEAALSSCSILAMGFGVLTLGHFLPVVNFGLLNVVVLFTGMVGDMFLLKGLMVIGERWSTRRERTQIPFRISASGAPGAGSSAIGRPRPTPPDWDRKGPVPSTVSDFILTAGLQAPSGENLQPWFFRQYTDRMDLFLNAETDSSFFNFRQRATLISTGAVLENMSVAATAYGLDTVILEEPAGEKDERVASLRFVSGSKSKDPLADVIWKRETNRRLYDKKPLPLDIQRTLEDAASDRGARLHLITERAGIDALAEAVYWADRVRVSLRECHEPLYHAIRKNAAEARARGDGFSFNNLLAGIDGRIFLTITRPWWMMRLANGIGISNKVAEIGRNGVASSSAVGLLTLPSDTALNYFYGGRALERVWLTAAARDLALQPMASVVLFWMVWRAKGEDPFPAPTRPYLRRTMDLVRPLFPHVNFDHDALVMLFRLGTADPMPEGTFRLPLDRFIK